MVRKILLGLLVLVAAFLAYVATRPDTFHVERSAVIHAPAEVVYVNLENFHRWQAWSPWERLDPNMKRTFSGADKGVGAVYAWVGNDKVGEGRMTITEATSPSHLGVRLDFIKPFASTSQTVFALTPQAEGTAVRWTMDGPHNFLSKTMCVFMSMDKMMGGDFERGLAALDSVATLEATTYAATDTSWADSTVVR